MAQSMNDTVRQILVDLVNRDPGVGENARRCEGILKDECKNQNKKEVLALGMAVAEGIVAELRSASGTRNSVALVERLVLKLIDERGLQEDLARWAVEIWALAYGVPVGPGRPVVEPKPEAAKAATKSLKARIPTTGYLSVTTDPPEAMISVDGLEQGVSPLVLRDLQAGSVTVSTKREGYVDTSQTMTIAVGKTTKADLTLMSTKIAIGNAYAGGIVFFYDGTGGGLVAAPTDQSTRATWSEAKKLCSSLVLNGFSDWRLTTTEELNLMYNNINKQSRGGFASAWYWSSSEGGGCAWFQYFSGGNQNDGAKVYAIHVRAVRAFNYLSI